MTEDHDLATIRQLLLAAFTADELRRFCYDRPAFQPRGHGPSADPLAVGKSVHLE